MKKTRIKYGCVMVFLDFPQIKTLHKVIKKEDIYDPPTDDTYGLEDEPHITLLYGLHKEVTDDDVRETLKGMKFPEITIEKISSFDNDDYDVLKFDVEDASLSKANEKLKKFPFTSDYPKYHPHMTIGYLKKGTAKQYIKDLKSSKYKIKPKHVIFSKADGSKTKIEL